MSLANLSPDTQVSPGVVQTALPVLPVNGEWRPESMRGPPVTYISSRFGMNWAYPECSDAVLGKGWREYSHNSRGLIRDLHCPVLNCEM